MATTLHDIKKIIIIALASDDQLMETLVLKGGNAIEFLSIGRQAGISRASYDLDFSISGDFDNELEEISKRIERTLVTTFFEYDLIVFGYKFAVKPARMSDELKDFWGGYNIEFKITTRALAAAADGDLEKMHRTAMALLPNGSPKVEIEISKYEYVASKKSVDIDGYTVYIYSEEMIVFEKLRAICQQLPEYAQIIPSHSPRPRARDFYDIYIIMEDHNIDLQSERCKQMIMDIFAAKKVPLEFIQNIQEHLAIHRQDWQNVLDTISAKNEVQDFDYYVKYVLEKFQSVTFL